MKEYVTALKALGDVNRARALLSLRKGELCLCQIVALLGLAPSTVSKHMSILRQAKLVESRKEEKWIYYKLPGTQKGSVSGKLIEITLKALAEDVQIKKDSINLERILKTAPEILCRIEKNKKPANRG
jgi:DNA-binding transcriptional ArsR family regulator